VYPSSSSASLSEGVADLVLVRPVRWLLRYEWPIAICVIVVAAGAWLISSFLPGQAISLVVPGDGEFTVAKAGRYTLWSQIESSSNGKLMTFPPALPPGVSIVITRQDGSTVPLRSEWPLTNHQTGPRSFNVAIGTITFDSPGSYRMTTEGLHEKRGLYLDQSDMRYFMLKVLLAMVLPFAFLGCIAWAVLIYVTRRRRRA
jgi:hypothetical protein